MLARSRFLGFGLLTLAFAGAALAQSARSKGGAAGFPVPRLMEEFRNAICSEMQIARELGGDKAKFLSLAQPYGPLDINMEEGRSPADCHAIKEYAYGYFATAAGLDGAAAQSGLNAFLSHYGRLQGRADFAGKAAELKRLSDLAGALAGLKVISQWSPTDYRVNNVIVTEAAGFREFKPTATMGFFPSCQATTIFNRGSVTGLKTIPEAKVAEILALMRKLGAVAVVKQAKWTRVIQSGVAEKEAGMLFPAAGQPAPAVTTYLSDGKKILVIEKVAEDGWYYLTT